MMTKLDIIFEKDRARIRRTASDNAHDLCVLAEREIKAADYQRISQYEIKENEITCCVIKLGDTVRHANKDIPFENDDAVIGKWEIKGVYAVKEDYLQDIFCDLTGFYGDDTQYLYFLPEGEEYWGFRWTKGYFISNAYFTGTSVSEYEIEEKADGTYMLITLRENEVARGGRPVYLSLKKVDSCRYSAKGLARKDDTDKPFINDEQVTGKWKSYSFMGASWEEADFPGAQEDDLYFRELEIFPDSNAKVVYEDAVYEGPDTVTWTKNYLLRKWNWSACEYEIRTVDGKDYMIIEWKSGDYRYGGYDTNYYVLTRA